jgi:hypothetical protein
VKKKSVLPKRIFITLQDPGPDQFLIAHEDSRGLEDGIIVGIYELVEIKKQRVTEELVKL